MILISQLTNDKQYKHSAVIDLCPNLDILKHNNVEHVQFQNIGGYNIPLIYLYKCFSHGFLDGQDETYYIMHRDQSI